MLIVSGNYGPVGVRVFLFIEHARNVSRAWSIRITIKYDNYENWKISISISKKKKLWNWVTLKTHLFVYAHSTKYIAKSSKTHRDSTRFSFGRNTKKNRFDRLKLESGFNITPPSTAFISSARSYIEQLSRAKQLSHLIAVDCFCLCNWCWCRE